MNIQLARRAVACKHWRWMPGMLTTDDFRITAINPDGLPHGEYSQVGPLLWKINAEDMPDLTDPATLGCLVALLRKAWDSPMLNTVQERGIGWIVADSLCCSMLANGRYYRGDTEAEALIAALEAAP